MNFIRVMERQAGIDVALQIDADHRVHSIDGMDHSNSVELYLQADMERK